MGSSVSQLVGDQISDVGHGDIGDEDDGSEYSHSDDLCILHSSDEEGTEHRQCSTKKGT